MILIIDELQVLGTCTTYMYLVQCNFVILNWLYSKFTFANNTDGSLPFNNLHSIFVLN